MNLIIIEGIDGSGKSTLAKSLEKRGFQSVTYTAPSRGASEEDVLDFFIASLTGFTSPVVFDRLHLSERIYGAALKRGSSSSERVERLVERVIEAIDGQVVISLPPWRTVLANWLERKASELVTTVVELRSVYQAYQHLYFNRRRNRNYIQYDYTRHRLTSFAHALT